MSSPEMPPARALILGGAGFVGVNVADALRLAGHDVAVTYRGQAPPFYLRNRVDEWIRVDLADADGLRDAMRGRDVVFHAAGHYPRYSLDLDAAVATGLAEMRNVLGAARSAGVRRVVYTSSIAVLERGDGAPATDEDVGFAPPTDSAYRAVKWHMERAVRHARRAGLDVVTLRPGGCLGPWDLRAGTGAMVVAVVRGALPWRVDGLVHMVDVRDVARAHAAAIWSPTGRSYNLPGHTVGVDALLERVASRFGGTAPRLVLAPDEARARADADERAAAPRRERVPLPREMVDVALSGVAVSDGLARRELCFDPRPLDDALDASVAWFRRTGHLPEASHPTHTPKDTP